MKNLKSYHLFEADGRSFTAYHTSAKPVKSLGEEPMWFTRRLDLAKAYHANIVMNNDKAFTYEVKIHGKILSTKELKKLLGMAGYGELISDLTANPFPKEAKKLTAPFIDMADGIDQWDYDPRDPDRDVESTLVF